MCYKKKTKRSFEILIKILIFILTLDLPKKEQINEITHFAVTAIESFTDRQFSACGNLSDIPCRFQYMVDQIDSHYPYER